MERVSAGAGLSMVRMPGVGSAGMGRYLAARRTRTTIATTVAAAGVARLVLRNRVVWDPAPQSNAKPRTAAPTRSGRAPTASATRATGVDAPMLMARPSIQGFILDQTARAMATAKNRNAASGK